MIQKIRDLLNKETKITVLKLLSISNIVLSIILLAMSSNIKIRNTLNRIDIMNNDINELLSIIKNSIKFNQYQLFYFVAVILFALYKYNRFGLIPKVVILMISSILGLLIKIFVIILEKACINELKTFKSFINGEIFLKDKNSSIINKLNLYYFNNEKLNLNNITIFEKDKEMDKEKDKEKPKKYKKHQSIYSIIRPHLSSDYEEKIENFKPIANTDINFDKVQEFLDNSLILKYQKYLILIYTLQIFINISLAYLPLIL